MLLFETKVCIKDSPYLSFHFNVHFIQHPNLTTWCRRHVFVFLYWFQNKVKFIQLTNGTRHPMTNLSLTCDYQEPPFCLFLLNCCLHCHSVTVWFRENIESGSHIFVGCNLVHYLPVIHHECFFLLEHDGLTTEIKYQSQKSSQFNHGH